MDYKIGSRVLMKKGHPCGANDWEVIRLGADIRIKCLKCRHSVLMPKRDFEKKVKTILEE